MRLLLVLILFVVCRAGFAQKKVASTEVPATIAYACVDRPGDLYVIMTNGETLKFDKNGKQIGKKKFNTVPTLFDPKDGTRAFAYFRETQTVESITPDLSVTDSSPLHPEFAVSAWLVCPSKNEFWILDGADLSLKKTKEKGTAIAYESKFSTTNNPGYMREYLNFLFILDNGIHILNNLGKEIRKIDAQPASFGFLGEEIYFISGGAIQLIDLYTTDKREIPLPHPAKFAFLTDDRMIVISDRFVEFFEFVP